MSHQVTVAAGLLTHPTTKLLRAKLGAEGVVAFVALVTHAAPTKGGLGAITPRKLALIAEWDGDEDALFSAMIECGAIDNSNPARCLLTDRESMYQMPATARSGKRWNGAAAPAPAAPAVPKSKAPPSDHTPYEAIRDAYHRHMVLNPKCRIMSDKTRAHIRKMWQDKSGTFGTVELWDEYFQYASTCKHLIGKGRTSPEYPRPFYADLAWLVGPQNMEKVVNGKYDEN